MKLVEAVQKGNALAQLHSVDLWGAAHYSPDHLNLPCYRMTNSHARNGRDAPSVAAEALSRDSLEKGMRLSIA